MRIIAHADKGSHITQAAQEAIYLSTKLNQVVELVLNGISLLVCAGHTVEEIQGYYVNICNDIEEAEGIRHRLVHIMPYESWQSTPVVWNPPPDDTKVDG